MPVSACDCRDRSVAEKQRCRRGFDYRLWFLLDPSIKPLVQGESLLQKDARWRLVINERVEVDS